MAKTASGGNGNGELLAGRVPPVFPHETHYSGGCGTRVTLFPGFQFHFHFPFSFLFLFSRHFQFSLIAKTASGGNGNGELLAVGYQSLVR